VVIPLRQPVPDPDAWRNAATSIRTASCRGRAGEVRARVPVRNASTSIRTASRYSGAGRARATVALRLVDWSAAETTVVYEPIAVLEPALLDGLGKGDLPGHEFRGNQYTDGEGAGGDDDEDSWGDRTGLEQPPRTRVQVKVDWRDVDLMDTAETGGVDEESILRDYGTKGWPTEVYRAWIPIEDLHEMLGDEPVDGPWQEDYSMRAVFPPAKVRVLPHGQLSLIDGNHRTTYWRQQGVMYVPAWVLDERPNRVGARIKKGDFEGHPFRGNQFTVGVGDGPVDAARRLTAKEQERNRKENDEAAFGDDWTPEGPGKPKEKEESPALRDARIVKEAKDAAARIAKEEGYTGRIAISTRASFGRLKNGDRAARVGGYDPATREITIHPLQLDGVGRAIIFGSTGTAEGTIAHEVNHARVYEAYRRQPRIFFDTIGNLAALEKLRDAKGSRPTAYAAGIWDWAAEAAGSGEKAHGQRLQLAAIETLAEYAGIQAMKLKGEKREMPAAWKKVRDTLHKASVSKKGEFRKGDFEGHPFRGNQFTSVVAAVTAATVGTPSHAGGHQPHVPEGELDARAGEEARIEQSIGPHDAEAEARFARDSAAAENAATPEAHRNAARFHAENSRWHGAVGLAHFEARLAHESAANAPPRAPAKGKSARARAASVAANRLHARVAGARALALMDKPGFTKGDAVGHPFRGNQYTSGAGGSAEVEVDGKRYQRGDGGVLYPPWSDSEIARKGPMRGAAFKNRATGQVVFSGVEHHVSALPNRAVIVDVGDPPRSEPPEQQWDMGYLGGDDKFYSRRDATLAWAEFERYREYETAKGDLPGHPFRGNQYSAGIASVLDSFDEADSASALAEKANRVLVTKGMAKQICASLGFDPKRVKVSTDVVAGSIDVDGKQFNRAGDFNVQTGEVTLYPMAISSPDELPGILAHEVGHARFEAAIEAIDREGKWSTEKATAALAKADGVTPYSRAYWKILADMDEKAPEKDRVRAFFTAAHETIAEINAAVAGGKPLVKVAKPVWRRFYRDVMRLSGGEVRKGDLDGHPFRGNQWTQGGGGGAPGAVDQRAIRLALASREAKQILHDEGVGLNSFTQGGCWLAAEAIQRAFGGKLMMVGSVHPDDPDTAEYRVYQHVVVQIGPVYYDANGPHTKDGLLRAWEAGSRPKIVPLVPKIARRDSVIPPEPKNVARLAAVIRGKVEKGDFDGHPFRGNQYTQDGGGEAPETKPREVKPDLAAQQQAAQNAISPDEHKAAAAFHRARADEIRDSASPTDTSIRAVNAHDAAASAHEMAARTGTIRRGEESRNASSMANSYDREDALAVDEDDEEGPTERRDRRFYEDGGMFDDNIPAYRALCEEYVNTNFASAKVRETVDVYASGGGPGVAKAEREIDRMIKEKGLVLKKDTVLFRGLSFIAPEDKADFLARAVPGATLKGVGGPQSVSMSRDIATEFSGLHAKGGALIHIAGLEGVRAFPISSSGQSELVLHSRQAYYVESVRRTKDGVTHVFTRAIKE
jgi:hypothetical protein